MKKKLETREDGKTRIILDDGTMGTNWFKTHDHALRAVGRAVLKSGDGWVADFNWKFTK